MVDIQPLGRAIKAAQYKHHRALDRALAEVGTTLAQWDALRAIANAPDSSAHELAETTFQTDQAFGTLASRLESAGLIRRQNARGRRIEHSLTAEGERTFRAGSVVADRVFSASFAGLDERERKTLLALLERVGT